MSATRPWDEASARALIDGLKHLEGATLPIFHALQQAFGHVDAAAVPLMAEALNLSRAEVLGVLSFYHDFRTVPEPRRIIRLCRAEACQAQGCEELAAGAAGNATIQTVYCLGLCAQGPAALVEGQPIARMDAKKLEALLAGAPVEAVQAGEGL